MNSKHAELLKRLAHYADSIQQGIHVTGTQMRTLLLELHAVLAEACPKSGRLETKVDRLAEALRIAEAALADIGDADRELGDDLEWCEQRAALGLRMVRDTLREHNQEVSNG